jgi:hypothetical protein
VYGMWKEVLKVRTKAADAAQASLELGQFLRPSELPAGLTAHKIFRNSMHPNEVMLVLDWDAPRPELGGSELARRLAYSMKRHGLVDLSAWCDEPRP